MSLGKQPSQSCAQGYLVKSLYFGDFTSRVILYLPKGIADFPSILVSPQSKIPFSFRSLTGGSRVLQKNLPFMNILLIVQSSFLYLLSTTISIFCYINFTLFATNMGYFSHFSKKKHREHHCRRCKGLIFQDDMQPQMQQLFLAFQTKCRKVFLFLP